MVLEIDRGLKQGYAIYEPPAAIPYDAVRIIDRIFDLSDPDNIFKVHALKLFEKATKDSEYPIPPPEVGMEMFGSANGLINRLLATEESRITDTKAWDEFKKILLFSI